MKKFLVGVVFLGFVLGGVGLYFWSYLERGAFEDSMNSSNVDQEFEIVSGESPKKIAENLEGAGLIRDKRFFEYYLWKTGTGEKIQAGIYALSPDMTIREMMEIFSDGKIVETITKITIPEGFTNKKIIERLKTIRPEIADEFESIVNCRCLNQEGCECDVFGDKYSFLTELPSGVDMEGYLFPDTYFIEDDETGRTLVSKFLNNFEKKLKGDLIDKINENQRSLHEIITLASVVEKEARNKEEREIVAGIFWNRLNDDHPLQSCATLAYVTGIDKKQYSIEDTQFESPYNTYINPGLPPGPIANPGLESITATVFPRETEYYFFLSDNETGEMVYSRTGTEHSENKLKHGL